MSRAGGLREIRTLDQPFRRRPLCPLSYETWSGRGESNPSINFGGVTGCRNLSPGGTPRGTRTLNRPLKRRLLLPIELPGLEPAERLELSVLALQGLDAARGVGLKTAAGPLARRSAYDLPPAEGVRTAQEACTGIRTLPSEYHPRRATATLYRLVLRHGLEPRTFGVSCRRSYQLS